MQNFIAGKILLMIFLVSTMELFQTFYHQLALEFKNYFSVCGYGWWSQEAFAM